MKSCFMVNRQEGDGSNRTVHIASTIKQAESYIIRMFQKEFGKDSFYGQMICYICPAVSHYREYWPDKEIHNSTEVHYLVTEMTIDEEES